MRRVIKGWLLINGAAGIVYLLRDRQTYEFYRDGGRLRIPATLVTALSPFDGSEVEITVDDGEERRDSDRS